jgi:integral membrane protein
MPGTPTLWFRTVAVAEALSWAGLLVGMLFKYVVSDNATGVHVFGPIHGGVFVLYVLTALVVRRPLRWSLATTAGALAASVPPFGSVVFERWATANGRLEDRAVSRI